MKKKKQQQQQPAGKKKGFSLTTFLLVLILLAGVGIMAYPTVSDWWNSMHATQAIANYVEAVEEMSQEDKDAILEAAREYNASLPNGVQDRKSVV